MQGVQISNMTDDPNAGGAPNASNPSSSVAGNLADGGSTPKMPVHNPSSPLVNNAHPLADQEVSMATEVGPSALNEQDRQSTVQPQTIPVTGMLVLGVNTVNCVILIPCYHDMHHSRRLIDSQCPLPDGDTCTPQAC